MLATIFPSGNAAKKKISALLEQVSPRARSFDDEWSSDDDDDSEQSYSSTLSNVSDDECDAEEALCQAKRAYTLMLNNYLVRDCAEVLLSLQFSLNKVLLKTKRGLFIFCIKQDLNRLQQDVTMRCMINGLLTNEVKAGTPLERIEIFNVPFDPLKQMSTLRAYFALGNEQGTLTLSFDVYKPHNKPVVMSLINDYLDINKEWTIYSSIWCRS